MATDRHSVWSVTINNPTSQDDEDMDRALQRGWKVEGQLEKGKEGTPHYQLLVRTGQVRFSAVKKAFPRAHIEPARNAAALAKYVQKEETKEGALPTSSEKYPSLSKLWHLIFEKLTQHNWINLNTLMESPGQRKDLWWKDCPFKHSLTILDELGNELIVEGYHVESMLVNPQIRSAWDKFHPAILYRSYVDSQTDRQRVQEDEIIIPTIDITNGLEEDESSRAQAEGTRASPSDDASSPRFQQ